MKIEELKTKFALELEHKQVLTPVDKYENKKRMIANYYMVYSFQALPLLIEKMKQVEPPTSTHQARFVIDQNGAIWFALEGPPGEDVEYSNTSSSNNIFEQMPAHSAMLLDEESYISAGIVVFSKNYEIMMITNFSGHLRPKPAKLLWPTAILHHQNAPFAAEVILKSFWKDANGKLCNEPLTLQRTELHTLIPEGYIPPRSSYEVRAHSTEQWEHFTDVQQVPQFKKKRKIEIVTSSLPLRSMGSFFSSSGANGLRLDSKSLTDSPKSFFAKLPTVTAPVHRKPLETNASDHSSSSNYSFPSAAPLASHAYETPPSSPKSSSPILFTPFLENNEDNAGQNSHSPR